MTVKDFEIDCPSCGSRVGVAIEDVAKEKTVWCRRGHSIDLKDDEGGFGKIQRSLDDLGF